MKYEFTLTYKLDPADSDLDDLIERLGEARCTDALVGMGLAGHLCLDFTRNSTSAEQAMLSAISDVNRAIPSAKLVEAGPDFVGLTDAADLVGVTRQNLRKLMVMHWAAFPSPVHAGSTSIWHLALVLQFLEARRYKFARPLIDIAVVAMQVNRAREAVLMGQPVDARFATANLGFKA